MNDDKQAENCIVQACEELTDLGIPLNSITVPDKATAILYKKLKSENASERIYNQINTMIINGKLRLSSSQQHTWDLKDND
jgi:hypothetical protein